MLASPQRLILMCEAPIHVDLAGSQTRRPLFTVRVGMRSRQIADERRQIRTDLLVMTAPAVKHGERFYDMGGRIA
jgi:hypothetical protein